VRFTSVLHDAKDMYGKWLGGRNTNAANNTSGNANTLCAEPMRPVASTRSRKSLHE